MLDFLVFFHVETATWGGQDFWSKGADSCPPWPVKEAREGLGKWAEATVIALQDGDKFLLLWRQWWLNLSWRKASLDPQDCNYFKLVSNIPWMDKVCWGEWYLLSCRWGFWFWFWILRILNFWTHFHPASELTFGWNCFGCLSWGPEKRMRQEAYVPVGSSRFFKNFQYHWPLFPLGMPAQYRGRQNCPLMAVRHPRGPLELMDTME